MGSQCTYLSLVTVVVVTFLLALSSGGGGGRDSQPAAPFSYQPLVTPGILCQSHYPPQFPRNTTEIKKLVNIALSKNLTLKVVGNRYSMTDCICTTGIPVSLYKIRHFHFNMSTQTVTVGVGMDFDEFVERLHIYGRAISGQPIFTGITVGGAIATGSHGSGAHYPSSLSQQLVSLSFVDGQGKLRRISKSHPDFRAFRVNLGLLGIIYEAEVLTVPQYKLYIRHIPVSDTILWNGTEVLDIAKEMDYFQFWWFPSNRQVVMAAGIRIPVHYPGNCGTRFIPNISTLGANSLSAILEMLQGGRDDQGLFHMQSYSKFSLYKEIAGLEPMFVEDDGETPCLDGPAVGFSHRITGNRCQNCAWDRPGYPLLMEDNSVAIPMNRLLEALQTFKKIFEKQLTQFPWRGILVRFLGQGDAYLGLNSGGGDWVAVEWATVPRWDRSHAKVGTPAYQLMVQVLVDQFGGRPHWGRNGLFYSNPVLIRRAFPGLPKFLSALNKYDPQEVFMNAFGLRLKHGMSTHNASPEYQRNCGLHDLCMCKKKSDCGNRGNLDHNCGTLTGFKKYPVCRPGLLEQMKEVYSQSAIDHLASAPNFDEKAVVGYLKRYTILNDYFVDDANQKKISKLNKINKLTDSLNAFQNYSQFGWFFPTDIDHQMKIDKVNRLYKLRVGGEKEEAEGQGNKVNEDTDKEGELDDDFLDLDLLASP